MKRKGGEGGGGHLVLHLPLPKVEVDGSLKVLPTVGGAPVVNLGAAYHSTTLQQRILPRSNGGGGYKN